MLGALDVVKVTRGISLDVYVQSDWEGDIRTRNATSDGAIMYGRHPS